MNVNLTNGTGAIVVKSAGLAAQVSGTVSLTGVTGVTLSATMALEMNTTGAAVNQVVQTGPTTNVTLNFTDGNFLQISGTAVIQVSGLIDISGDFAFRKVGTAPNQVITIGASNVNASLGAGGVNVNLTNGAGAIVVKSAGLAAQVSGTVSLTGVTGVTLSATMALEMNTTGAAVNQVVQTGPTTNVTLNFTDGNFLQISGTAVIQVSGLIDISGDFAFRKVGTAPNQVITIGASNVNASLGAGGVSVNLTNGAGAIVVKSAGLAAQVSGTVSLTGVTGVTLSATMALEMNTTGAAVNQVVQTGPTTNVTLNFTDGNFLQISGTAVIQVSGLIDISGDFAFRKVGTAPNQVITIGASNVNASLGAGGVNVNLTNGTGAIVVKSAGLAAQVSGTVSLTGVTGVTLSATMALEMNTTGAAVNQGGADRADNECDPELYRRQLPPDSLEQR